MTSSDRLQEVTCTSVFQEGLSGFKLDIFTREGSLAWSDRLFCLKSGLAMRDYREIVQREGIGSHLYGFLIFVSKRCFGPYLVPVLQNENFK